jgi:hypothetical protein
VIRPASGTLASEEKGPSLTIIIRQSRNKITIAWMYREKAVEKGLMELDEGLKARVQQHKQTRESLLTEIAAMKRKQQSPLQTITPQKIEAVTKTVRSKPENTYRPQFGIMALLGQETSVS